VLDWINVIVQGTLVGGLYAMFAAGLSLIFGIMRLVNIAHGDLIVLAAYLALVTTQTLGIGPLAALLIVVPLMALIGYGLQRLILNRTLGDDLLPPLLVTFGLSVIIQNGLLELFSADSRKLQAGAIDVASFPLMSGVSIGLLPLLSFIVAVGHRRAAIRALPHRARPCVPGHRGRPCGRAAHGARQPAHLRPRHGAVARRGRGRGRVPGDARQL